LSGSEHPPVRTGILASEHDQLHRLWLQPAQPHACCQAFPSETFVRDLQDVLDIATQAFSSLSVSALPWPTARHHGLGQLPWSWPTRIATCRSWPRWPPRSSISVAAGLVLGYGFPPASIRIARLVEALRLMRAMWSSAGWGATDFACRCGATSLVEYRDAACSDSATRIGAASPTLSRGRA